MRDRLGLPRLLTLAEIEANGTPLGDRLIAYDSETLGPKARVEVISCASNGKLQFDPVHTFVPSEKNGPVTNTLALELHQGLSKSLYTVIGNDR